MESTPSRKVAKFFTIWLTLDVLPVLPLAGVKIDREGGDIDSRRCRSIANANVFEPIACNLAELGIEAAMVIALFLFHDLELDLNCLEISKKDRTGKSVEGSKGGNPAFD